jgi:long-chain acyl-CoA synthetase
MTVDDECARLAAGLTIPALLHRNATEFGALPALSMVGAAESETLTWAGLREAVAHWTLGLAGHGLHRGDRMLIMMSARPEHWLADLAAVHLGAVPCTAYDTLSPDQLRYLGQHSRTPLVVLEGAAQLARWQPVLDELPDLKTVVVLDETAIPADDSRFRSAAEVLAAGAARHAAEPRAFEQDWPALTPDDPVAMLYTSGTTGDPKGVVLTHHNVIFQSATVETLVPTPEHAPSISYLPLAHIAERMLGIYLPVFRAGHVHICPDAKQLIGALQKVRPASIFGVPRVWEKMAAGLRAMVDAMPEEQRTAFEHAHELRLKAYRLRANDSAVPTDLAEEVAKADEATLLPIRAMFGLDNLTWAGGGAAPLPVDVLYTLAGLGVEIYEVWGMTETTGTASINTPDNFRPGSVGRANLGMEVKVVADGEIFVRGSLVCKGYLQPDGSVAKQTDDEGWLATGDVGTLDEDGYLTITDRKKELIITSSGKNIPPARIEGLLRSHPLVGQAMAVGDRRPYVTALVVLDEESTPNWARAKGLDVPDPTDLAALATHPAVLAEIAEAVNAANERLARAEQIKKYLVLPQAWTPDSGELTPTLKLRRKVINDRFTPQIEEFYAEPAG